ncbi:metal ABC transporter ATP-binding protein [Kerstersia sp.]|uniref:metal ABC transporter ATP-binding protein n=1 Tax=Kerstersia sp. TaxID=1930783 RepID=UPI003F8FE808
MSRLSVAQPLPAAVSLRGLCVGWRERIVLHDLNGDVRHGSLTAIVGANGSGKSTLLRTMMEQLPPSGGTVSWADWARQARAWLPQACAIDRSMPVRVIDLVALGAWRRVGPWGRLSRAEWERAHAALEAAGLGFCANRPLRQLSGGQMQRVLFARLIMQDAQVLLLDEPFAAVDGETIEDLMQLLHGWHAEGRTIIAVLHDLELVRQHFPDTLLLGAGGMLAWGPSREVLSAANLQRARQSGQGEWL